MRRTDLTSTLNLCHDIFISEEITVGRKDADPAPTITLSGLRYIIIWQGRILQSDWSI